MNVMTTLERLELSFLEWVKDYNRQKWELLSTDETDILANYYWNDYISIVKSYSKESDPLFDNQMKV